ncbi:monovalent cation/H(+) antiporter subunit G [Allostreptomyces psammosilenae]|uniref:Multicomponent Na+:H+ antiporter subunit G n=1 Tax=Allostreptomyces psammosilenae TaxID=1892865 RepID=A0A852ZPD0_9ACTN|nr:monovalent cation/H(+) antiporter subunit G [Allostreptomyces psammosilenae]NYI04306.1 multicomponent Na+:H+ antiporter subunit G [Allostreptomyces psammosilenae]
MSAADVASAVLMIGGAVLSVTAGVGLLRLPDVLARMQVSAKPQVLGLTMVLSGAAVQVEGAGDVATIVLVVLFQLLTVPVTATMVGWAAHRTGQLEEERLLVDEPVPGDSPDADRGGPAA